jgi:hypothetical protein
VLEALGVVIVQQPSGIERCLGDAGIAFMFACASLAPSLTLAPSCIPQSSASRTHSPKRSAPLRRW